ncbi:hypothetical protein DPMN_023574 [Dreissena polymorpha]|uniref:Uncharacterized protein n=1 Tax=Dreissena polymorpha TaxID=45954 RepID=A0A9D4LMY6_DREPO|nr:hypothetical protein DPMN_023574 [Dreissena polymorpha]
MRLPTSRSPFAVPPEKNSTQSQVREVTNDIKMRATVAMVPARVTKRNFHVPMASITNPHASAPANSPKPWAETERAISAEEVFNVMRRSTIVGPATPINKP